jgi:tripeptidyl-peptidase-2
LPKEEIGAVRFLEKNPRCDGRGVVVAIFDSGVDPGAAGLARTSDDKPKIIDLIDGTGSGDVDTSATREAKDGKLQGLSGRELQLDAAWIKPSRKFRVGMKRAYDFFPAELIARLKRERRVPFDKEQREAETALRRQLAELDDKADGAKARREDLEARLRQLLALEKQYDDPGPVYDCVVFHDGQAWQAAVDTDEDGDLADETLLTDYRDCLRYGTFGGNSRLNSAARFRSWPTAMLMARTWPVSWLPTSPAGRSKAALPPARSSCRSRSPTLAWAEWKRAPAWPAAWPASSATSATW